MRNSESGTQQARLISVEFMTFQTILMETMTPFGQDDFLLVSDGRVIDHRISSQEESDGTFKLTLLLDRAIELERCYEIVLPDQERLRVLPSQIVRTMLFDRKYSYEGPLGLVFQEEKIAFYVWSPIAERIECVRYDQEEQEIETKELVRQERGAHHLIVPRQWEHSLYRYRVTTYLGTHEIVDPYAKAVSTNGRFGVLLDIEHEIDQHFPHREKRPILIKPTDAILYEAHVRDFTVDPSSGSAYPGQYLGVVESGTVSPEGRTTGIDYLLELGVTHLQLLPVHFFTTTEEVSRSPYNWGYDPVQWFSLAGSYASDPTDPKVRILEYAEMVERLHAAGIRVTFDVVMNHVYIREHSALEHLVPGYYFRYELDGTLANGTGVGNDTASERFMMRRMIVDCLTYFADVFRIDAFRFDLMGIHDIETMNAVRAALDAIDPTILVYGEGWDLATPLPHRQKATSSFASQMPKVGHFNDVFRDALKGSTFSETDRGFVSGNGWPEGEVRNGMAGSITLAGQTAGRFPEPTYSINYVEAHDNHTLYDKLVLARPDLDERIRLQMSRLAQTIVFLSAGIPFLHAGQEFGRTKGGVENSYNAPDAINRIDWTLRDRHARMVDYLKNILQIRRMHGGFRLHRANQIQELFHFLPMRAGVIAYEVEAVHSYDAWQRTLVVHNVTMESVEIALDHNRWNVHVQGERASVTPIEKGVARIMVLPLSTTIATC
ncbi:type I pullulanase [Exiguobacterium sp. KRL4]|uniref:type I pullulanase n=1 Tax=Exiguobacterium sp. KRL4 TaxID=1914536 RepID=UPI0008F8602D|nr:type I pullulanase [Exiguobacterium sp. KRL4]OIN67089.1 type I pullulanase [Exiguobacterium sp. KRL4]